MTIAQKFDDNAPCKHSGKYKNSALLLSDSIKIDFHFCILYGLKKIGGQHELILGWPICLHLIGH